MAQYSESDLKNFIAKILKVDPSMIDDKATPDTIENWDSLAHMDLIIALEEFFNVSFTEDQSVEILSYPLIKAVLSEHGVQFSG